MFWLIISTLSCYPLACIPDVYPSVRPSVRPFSQPFVQQLSPSLYPHFLSFSPLPLSLHSPTPSSCFYTPSPTSLPPSSPLPPVASPPLFRHPTLGDLLGEAEFVQLLVILVAVFPRRSLVLRSARQLRVFPFLTFLTSIRLRVEVMTFIIHLWGGRRGEEERKRRRGRGKGEEDDMKKGNEEVVQNICL